MLNADGSHTLAQTLQTLGAGTLTACPSRFGQR
jgi:hypothetical protein